MKTTTLPIRNSMSRSPFRRVSVLIPLVLVCFGLSPKALATDLGSVVAGNNTADGSGVLVNRSTGINK